MRRKQIWVLALCACTTSDFELSVDTLTDLQAPVEIDRLEVQLDGVVVFDGLPSGRLAEGTRLVDLEVAGGDHTLIGRAFLQNQMLTERRVIVRVRQNQGVTLVLTRNCRDTECVEGSTCANSTCVDPQCSPETPQFCEPSGQCAVDTDCEPAGVCGSAECRLGACLLVDDGRCGTGMFCAGGDGCVETPSLVDGGSPDAHVADTGPPRTCPEPWGTLPVTSAAVTGFDRGGGLTATFSVTPASALLAPAMTMEMWVRFIESEQRMSLMGNGNTEDETGFAIGVDQRSPGESWVTYTVERFGFLLPAPGLTDGCWHHVAFIRDLEAGTLAYVQDGTYQSQRLAPRTTSVAAGEPGLFFGRNAPGDTPRAHVAIHHLRFWNTAMSEAELIALSTSEASVGDPRLIDAIPMQELRPADGVDHLDSRGTLDVFLGWWGSRRGNAPGMLLSLDDLDSYAAGF